jgi:hypothetical protein
MRIKKIASIEDLSDTITAVVNRAVQHGTLNTTTGVYTFGPGGPYKDLIVAKDYYRFIDLIAAEISDRPEVIEVEIDSDKDIIINFGLDYCPNYEWREGDEATFGCTYQEWVMRQTEPVSQRESIAEIARWAERNRAAT